LLRDLLAFEFNGSAGRARGDKMPAKTGRCCTVGQGADDQPISGAPAR